MFQENKINNVKVKPVITSQDNINNIRGYKLFPFKNYITYICSRKKSGKTSLISTIIEKTTTPKTIVWLFCSTHAVDKTWLTIIKNLEDRNYIVNCFDSITDGSGTKTVDNLDMILKELNTDESSESTAPSLPSISIPETVRDRFGNQTLKKKNLFKDDVDNSSDFNIHDPASINELKSKVQFTTKKDNKKAKLHVPKNLFIFDDISQQLRLKSVQSLFKTHRHSDSSIICSSQWANDLAPQSILQCDILITFKSFSKEKLEHIHQVLDVGMPFEDFWNGYQQATEGDYNFFYYNIRTDEMRKNFNSILERIK